MSRLSFLSLSTTPMLLMIVYALIASAFVLYVARRALRKSGRAVPHKVVLGLPIAAVLAVIVAYSIMVVNPVRPRKSSPSARCRSAATIRACTSLSLAHATNRWRSRDRFLSWRRSIPMRSCAAARHRCPKPSARLRCRPTDSDVADLTFPYQLNADWAWKVYTVIGPTYEASLLNPRGPCRGA